MGELARLCYEDPCRGLLEVNKNMRFMRGGSAGGCVRAPFLLLPVMGSIVQSGVVMKTGYIASLLLLVRGIPLYIANMHLFSSSITSFCSLASGHTPGQNI